MEADLHGAGWRVVPSQQVPLHHVYTVVDRRPDQDGQRHGLHGAHLPPHQVEDADHDADHTCNTGHTRGKVNRQGRKGAYQPRGHAAIVIVPSGILPQEGWAHDVLKTTKVYFLTGVALL